MKWKSSKERLKWYFIVNYVIKSPAKLIFPATQPSPALRSLIKTLKCVLHNTLRIVKFAAFELDEENILEWADPAGPTVYTCEIQLVPSEAIQDVRQRSWRLVVHRE